MTRSALALVLTLSACGDPIAVRDPGCSLTPSVPDDMRTEVRAECDAQAERFGVHVRVAVRSREWFDFWKDVGAFGDWPSDYEIIGAHARILPSRVVISETVLDDGRWPRTLCHEIQHRLGHPHECDLCEYDACEGEEYDQR